MKSKYLLLAAVVVLTVALAGMVFGCGSDSSTDTTAASTAPSTDQSTAEESTDAEDTTEPKGDVKAIEFKMALEHGAESPYTKDIHEPWAAAVEEATEGRVKISLYPAEALGPADTYLDAVKTGMIDIGWSCLEYFEGRFVLSMVGYYPIGAGVDGTSSLVWWDLYKEFPEIQAEFDGVKVLAVDGSPAYQVFTSKKSGKEVHSVADTKGLKLKAGGDTLNDAVAAIGGAPVTMPAPHMFEALQKGTLDGAWFPLPDALMFGIEEVCHAVTLVDGPPCGFFTIMNPDAYAKMSPEDQEIFDSLTGDYLVKLAAKVRYEASQEAIQAMEAAGVKVIVPTPEDYAAFQAALDTIVEPWLAKNGEIGAKIHERARELAAQYEADKWWEK